MLLQLITNNTYESEKALFDVEKQKYIMRGDYYHDKIDERIEGFIAGLRFAEYDFKLLPEINALPDDDIFELCEFYDATND